MPPVTHWFSTGSTLLDLAISEKLSGGIPGGRITHLFGKESTAKTVVAAEILGSVQRQNGKAHLIDAEGTFDLERAQNLYGIRTEESSFVYTSPFVEHKEYKYPETIEDLFENYLEAVIEDQKGLKTHAVIVVDSLAALTSRKEEFADLDSQGYGATRAKCLSIAFRKYVKHLASANISLVFVDQTRQAIGQMFGDKNKTSSGEAIKFYASTRVQLSLDHKIKNKKKRITGVSINFRVIKNKVGCPFRYGRFPVVFNMGLDDVTSLVEWLKEETTVKGKRSFVYKDKSFGSVAACVDYIEDGELEGELQQEAATLWHKVHADPVRKPRRRIERI